MEKPQRHSLSDRASPVGAHWHQYAVEMTAVEAAYGWLVLMVNGIDLVFDVPDSWAGSRASRRCSAIDH
ncbi:hypothetical protein SAMN04488120_1215 [Fontimonas thermophila]|uniref:Uncharacterized protein n=1 Tax=Fontimonas thermophila TaxID=1076937 RepID=A0A1I2KJJ8_9GAMM|nr:hypothetical protein SAMN04488120_1215 [Fontimonas thermophila]